MNIPQKLPAIINSDIPIMVERALKEANPLYPVPKILFNNDMVQLYEMIKES